MMQIPQQNSNRKRPQIPGVTPFSLQWVGSICHTYYYCLWTAICLQALCLLLVFAQGGGPKGAGNTRVLQDQLATPHVGTYFDFN